MALIVDYPQDSQNQFTKNTTNPLPMSKQIGDSEGSESESGLIIKNGKDEP